MSVFPAYRQAGVFRLQAEFQEIIRLKADTDNYITINPFTYKTDEKKKLYKNHDFGHSGFWISDDSSGFGFWQKCPKQ